MDLRVGPKGETPALVVAGRLTARGWSLLDWFTLMSSAALFFNTEDTEAVAIVIAEAQSGV